MVSLVKHTNTDSYIREFNQVVVSGSKELQPKLEKIHHWIFQHPTTVKVSEIGGMILGAAAIISLPITLPAIGIFGGATCAIAGGLLGTISFVAHQSLDIVAPPMHDMRNHAFKPSSFDTARLYYQGDVPVLEIISDDPYRAGKSHGYLMGEYLNEILTKLNTINWIGQKFGEGFPPAKELPHVISEFKKILSEDELNEIQGIADGFNQWSKQQRWFKGKDISADDLVLFHLMPDSEHFLPQHVEQGNKHPVRRMPGLVTVGCSVVADADQKEGMTVGRNMDWPSFGIFGKYSLLINRKYKDKKRFSTAEIGFPGFAGTLTGMNEKGLCVFMNVCAGETNRVRGLPAAFYNRRRLENCGSVEEVAEQVSQKGPLGRYHMTVAGPSRSAEGSPVAARSFHMYQDYDNDNSHVVREWKNEGPLVVTNAVYPSEREIIGNMHHSQERTQLIQDLFREAVNRIPSEQREIGKLVTQSLALPYVDNLLTTHKIVMKPETRKMQVAFNNAYAGADRLHEVDTSLLFN